MIYKIFSNVVFIIRIIHIVCKYWFVKDPYVVLFMAPDYGNVGDLLIDYAEKEIFLESNPNTRVIEIPAKLSRNYLFLYKHLVKDHKVYITGGGYLGTQWLCYEENVRKIIEEFRDQPIVILPQTLYFEETEWGEKQRQLSREIYGGHKNLTLCVREKYSLKVAEELFPHARILLIPDMVTMLKLKETNSIRKGAVICMRADSERFVSEKTQQMIYDKLRDYFKEEEIDYKDTMYPGKMKWKGREKLVKSYIRFFSAHKIVITDRLHGMVLAAITGTPCIAFDNMNYKVRGVYEWIRGNEYIHYLNDPKQFEAVLRQCMQSDEQYHYEDEQLKDYRKRLIQDVILH